jgi:hypothetical protein
MKKFTTLALATAMTAAMACTAFAGVKDTTVENSSIDNGGFYYDLVAAGYDPSTVTGAVITFTLDDSDGFGGGYMMCGSACSWVQKDGEWDWGNPDSEKPVLAVPTGNAGEYTLTVDFSSSDVGFGSVDGDDYYAKICVQQWWGNEMTVTGVQVITTGDSTEDTTPTEDTSNPDGDVAPVAYLAAVVALAGVALVASKKVRA